jgi:hypothetical protein
LGNVLKPKAMQNCNKHMGCVDKSDRMADSYRLIDLVEMDKKAVFFI